MESDPVLPGSQEGFLEEVTFQLGVEGQVSVCGEEGSWTSLTEGTVCAKVLCPECWEIGSWENQNSGKLRCSKACGAGVEVTIL